MKWRQIAPNIRIAVYGLPTCSVAHCDADIMARRLCKRHYSRWYMARYRHRQQVEQLLIEVET